MSHKGDLSRRIHAQNAKHPAISAPAAPTKANRDTGIYSLSLVGSLALRRLRMSIAQTDASTQSSVTFNQFTKQFPDF